MLHICACLLDVDALTGKFALQPSKLMNVWRKGLVVQLEHKEENPLLEMKSCDADTVPPEMMVRDILCLLKWLKSQYDHNQVQEVVEVVTKGDEKEIKRPAEPKQQRDGSSSRKSKKKRRKRLKEIKRLQSVAMLKKTNVSVSTQTSAKKQKGTRSGKLWQHFDAIVEAFWLQWKFRSVFIGAPDAKSRRREFAELYEEKMSPIAMHFQSVIFGIYETVFAFLRLQSNKEWYRELYRNRHQQGVIPGLKLFDEDIETVKVNIDAWAKTKRSKAVDIPFVWDVFHVKLFHWIFLNIDTAKQWIAECTQ